MASTAPADADGTPDVTSPPELRMRARALFWQGWTIANIAREIGQKYTTVDTWKRRDDWEGSAPLLRAEDATSARLILLTNKENKSGTDFKEIDLLWRAMEHAARCRKFGEDGKPGSLNPKVKNGAISTNEKKEQTKNLITFDMAEKLRSDFTESVSKYRHQHDWLATTALKTRFILKSRQIGATWTFARERFLRGLETGNNQLFISASRAQAHVFRGYIVAWVERVCGVTLKGDPITVQREGEDGERLEPFGLHFLGTNYRTAQSYPGDVIIDECFWIHSFEEIYKVASAMATHDRYTVTLFSTPSIISHQAYPMWSGERFNEGRAKSDHVRIDISHEALKDGRLGPDGIWRQIVTLQDACGKGFDLTSVGVQQARYSVAEFDQLFRCMFMDDAQSMFPFAKMRKCMVDSWDAWKDYTPYGTPPFSGEVWLGYDPTGDSGMGDNAALVAVSPPDKPGGKFRVIAKERLLGKDYQAQANLIRDWCGRFNVTKIGMDTTGIGKAVFQLVQAFFPAVEAFNYSVQTKTALVLKAKNVIDAGRLQFDNGWVDMISAFTAIRPQITKGGGQVTYVASRAGGTGHADLAFAVMHALFFEPMDALRPQKKSRLEIFK